MRLLSWLRPGIGVKRWILLLALGALSIAAGGVVSFPTLVDLSPLLATLSVDAMLAGGALLAGGTDEQKSHWLPRLAAGDPLCAIVPRFLINSSRVIPMPLSRMTNTLSVSFGSSVISNGSSLRTSLFVSVICRNLSSASEALETNSRMAISRF